MQAVIDRSGLPFATMFMDKSGLEERQSGFVGMHEGALMTEEVRDSTVDHAARVMPATSCQVWKARSRAAR